jgi:hypothetical protein
LFVGDQWGMLLFSQARVADPAAAAVGQSDASASRRLLTEADAIDIWIAR